MTSHYECTAILSVGLCGEIFAMTSHYECTAILSVGLLEADSDFMTSHYECTAILSVGLLKADSHFLSSLKSHWQAPIRIMYILLWRNICYDKPL
jgi:hypothetical protein